MEHHPSETNGLLVDQEGYGKTIFQEDKKIPSSDSNVETYQEFSNLERFSDLVFALSIHILASQVVENQFFDPKVWLTFWLRVFLLHSIWSSGIVLTNIGNVWTGQSFQAFHHHLGLFTVTALVGFFVKGCERNDTNAVVILYLVGRGLAAGAWSLHAICPRPGWMDPERHGRIKGHFFLMPVTLILDCGPLVVAMTCFGHHEDVVLWSGLITALLGLAFRIAFAEKLNLYSECGSDSGVTTDSAHMKERHDLITLVLLVDIFLAATTSAEDYLGSISSVAAILTSLGCFSLYFNAQVKGRIDACSLSPRAYCLNQHLQLVLFCTIPTLAVAFSQIILIDEHTLFYIEINAYEYRHPQTLLSGAVAVYLVAIAEMESLSADPVVATPLVSKLWRVKFNLFMGILVGGASHFYDNAMLMAAVSTLFTALVQFVFVQNV